MFPGTINNSNMAIPMMPPPNYCPPPVYGNVPFHPPFATSFYPPFNYYCSPPPFNSPNSQQNPQLPTDFSKPPPGYGANSYHLPQNFGNGNHIPSYQHVHMANVLSTNFAGYTASNTSPMTNGTNQFSKPPPPISQMNGGSINNANRSSNRKSSQAREWPYFCQTCDRGFTSMNKFKEHNSQHRTCGMEGCTFSAHEKIVEKHVMMQHRTPGLFNRIVKGYSPEEIEKWVNERKKFFPTKEKIEVKEAQREEMRKRGEQYAERRQKFNQRNSHYKNGPGNRFNNRNGQFRNKSYGHRRHLSVNRTADKNDQPQNKKRIAEVPTDDDCLLRNLLPFKGTAFYKHLENASQSEEEHLEYTITDDDDVSVWSDDDVKIICNPTPVDKNAIFELKKCGEISQLENNSEEKAVDKPFKNSDNMDDIDEVFDDCQSDHSDLRDDPKIQNNTSSKDSVSLVSSVGDSKSALKTMSSLALLQCYDSDDDTNDENDDVDQNNSTEKNDLRENDEPEERPFKSTSDKDGNPKIESLGKFETEKNNNSSDDSEPDEYSSKCIPTEENSNCCQTNSYQSEIIKSSTNKDLQGDACSLKGADETESKKRKRRRQRDGKSVVGGEESDKKPIPEAKISRVFPPRKRYKPLTLLEKLLHGEIKHERNLILQCIRHTVGNDYFGIK